MLILVEQESKIADNESKETTMAKTKRKATHKSIGYAYASSPLAKECGQEKTGCYYLETVDETVAGVFNKRVALLAHFPTYQKAVAAAELLALPYSQWTLKH